VIMLRAGRFVVRIPVALGDLYFLKKAQTSSGGHPANYSVGTEVLSWGKAAGHEVDNSNPPSAQVMDEYSYSSTLVSCFMARTGYSLL
jgi:hypothetical protein